MHRYELIFLLKKKEDEKIVKEIVHSIPKAKILKEESWGEKTLAYPIKKNRQAFYFIYHLEIDKKNVLELKQRLNFEEKILRYLLLSVEKK